MTHSPLGLHVTYRCGRTLFVKADHARRHRLVAGRWVAANVCAACRYFEERKA